VTISCPPGLQSRYASLDAWRGVVCLLIIAYHSSLVYANLAAAPDGALESVADSVLRAATYGNLRVPLFFVISGFCIAAAAESVRQGRRSAGAFFYRRFRRIYPPFWIVVGASVLFFFVVDHQLWPRLLSTEPWSQPRPWWYSGWQWVGNLTLTETWREHVVGGPRGHFPGQAWTLCYEEQFYAVTGGLLLLSPRRLYHGVIGVTLATLLAVSVWDYRAISGFFFDGTWLSFAAGVLVYWIVANQPTARAKAAASVVLVGMALLTPWLPIPGGAEAFVFSAALLWLHRWDSVLVAQVWVRPLTYCGQMCYSLYLVHQLIVKAVSQGAWELGLRSAPETLLLTVPACFAAAIIVGRGCYLAVERRFLNTPSSRVARTPAGAVSPASNVA
jgi:peptidoglycan/LPS O-acetylase OafA/YrhL